MGSTFRLGKRSEDDHRLWMPNSAIFIRAMRAIHHELESVDERIATIIAKARDSDLSFIDISDWAEHDFNILFKAINRVEGGIFESIKQGNVPQFSYTAIAGLKLLLYFDKRYQGNDLFPYKGEIWITPDNIWHQVDWIYDFTLVHFLSSTVHDTQKFKGIRESLLEAKTTRQLRLDQESDWNLQWYLSEIDGLKQWYVDGRQSVAVAPFIKKDYGSAIADLNQRFWKTHKATIDMWLKGSE